MSHANSVQSELGMSRLAIVMGCMSLHSLRPREMHAPTGGGHNRLAGFGYWLWLGPFFCVGVVWWVFTGKPFACWIGEDPSIHQFIHLYIDPSTVTSLDQTSRSSPIVLAWLSVTELGSRTPFTTIFFFFFSLWIWGFLSTKKKDLSWDV